MARFLHRDKPTEEPCPRCGIPTPQNATDCSACGWNLNEAYHADFVGSHIGATDEPQSTGTQD